MFTVFVTVLSLFHHCIITIIVPAKVKVSETGSSQASPKAAMTIWSLPLPRPGHSYLSYIDDSRANNNNSLLHLVCTLLQALSLHRDAHCMLLFVVTERNTCCGLGNKFGAYGIGGIFNNVNFNCGGIAGGSLLKSSP